MEQQTEQIRTIDLIYPLAMTAYDTAQRRLESTEKRIQEVLLFAVTLTLGATTALSALHFNLRSPWFLAAMVVFIVGLCIGVYARIYGSLRLIDISTLHEYAGREPDRYKDDFVFYAGQHWDVNCTRINKRANLGLISAACFLAEIGIMIAALAFGRL